MPDSFVAEAVKQAVEFTNTRPDQHVAPAGTKEKYERFVAGGDIKYRVGSYKDTGGAIWAFKFANGADLHFVRTDDERKDMEVAAQSLAHGRGIQFAKTRFQGLRTDQFVVAVKAAMAKNFGVPSRELFVKDDIYGVRDRVKEARGL